MSFVKRFLTTQDAILLGIILSPFAVMLTVMPFILIHAERVETRDCIRYHMQKGKTSASPAEIRAFCAQNADFDVTFETMP